MIAAARDIVEHCGVARMLHVDFPLGSPCGEPFNVTQQRAIQGLKIREPLVFEASTPGRYAHSLPKRATVRLQSPHCALRRSTSTGPPPRA